METVCRMSLDDVKDQCVLDMVTGSITTLLIDDDEYKNTYEIKVQKTNLGLGGMCFLDGQPSYQADFQNGKDLKVRDIVNKIAGGEII